MKKLLLLLFVTSIIFNGCRSRQADDGKPVVTVTILPLRYFVEELSGDHFRINVLVPPGASHHNYDPTPRQLKDLEKSGALFVNGHLGFENAWIPKMRSNYHNLLIVDLSEGIGLINVEGGEGSEDHEHEHEGVDPHYWMSVDDARLLAGNMARGLIRADPACRQMVEGNLTRLDHRLDSLSESMHRRFMGMNHRSFMIFHPALAYLARDYQMNQYSMELAGKEPTAMHFRKLVDLARAEKINTIFIQKEYDQENAQTFARETGARIVVIDPMSPDWFSEMENLANKIANMDNR